MVFGLDDAVTPYYLAMNATLAIHGLVLAVWLIARGFDTRSSDPLPVTQP